GQVRIVVVEALREHAEDALPVREQMKRTPFHQPFGFAVGRRGWVRRRMSARAREERVELPQLQCKDAWPDRIRDLREVSPETVLAIERRDGLVAVRERDQAEERSLGVRL